MTAREAALKALSGCRRGEFSEEAINKAVNAACLDERDSALCSRIVYTSLQNETLLDLYIGKYSSVAVKRLEPRVLDILRLSAAQMLFMDRIPHSAAVSEGVELCRKAGLSRAGGLVNAVLRRISENAGDQPELPERGTPEYLAARYSHPLWLASELCAERGYEFTEAFFAANNTEPPIFAQTNTLRTDADALALKLRARGVEVGEGSLPGSLILRGAGRPDALPEFGEGLFYIQDEAARRAVETAGIAPGMTVLDACAAPGGKSFAAAMLLRGSGEIIACDVSEKKLARIRSGAERLGVGNISVRAMDARSPDAALREAADVVIADAPCSGLGVIRKKPEIRRKTREENAPLPEIQLSILEGLAQCVKRGGTLLYSTCTVLRRENGDVAAEFVSRHPEFSIDSAADFWPHIHQTDGFFVCRMIRSK